MGAQAVGLCSEGLGWLGDTMEADGAPRVAAVPGAGPYWHPMLLPMKGRGQGVPCSTCTSALCLC